MSGTHFSMLLRMVFLRVPTIPNPVRVVIYVGGQSSKVGIGKSQETIWLQLMCCTLSELCSFQFTRGQIK
jgi:hypothetical protein